jgi:hypothetical protein
MRELLMYMAVATGVFLIVLSVWGLIDWLTWGRLSSDERERISGEREQRREEEAAARQARMEQQAASRQAQMEQLRQAREARMEQRRQAELRRKAPAFTACPRCDSTWINAPASFGQNFATGLVLGVIAEITRTGVIVDNRDAGLWTCDYCHFRWVEA